ncbi:MAG: Na+/H+ antiporter subunit C [Polyangiaceae bacterium]
MEDVLALMVGSLYAAGIYMMIRRSAVKLIVGLVMLGHAANLLIFTSAGVVRAAPPIAAKGGQALLPPYADPLPQALVLTAIVIGFGIQAFALLLVRCGYGTTGTDDLDSMTAHDR